MLKRAVATKQTHTDTRFMLNYYETNAKAALSYRQSAISNLIRSANFVKGYPYVTQDSLSCNDSEMMS